MLPLKKLLSTSLGALTLSMTLLGAAHATDIYSGTMSVAATDATQLGRLSRNGVPTDWSSSLFPGIVNASTTYHYSTMTLDINTLEAGYQFGSYIQINVDSPYTTTFLSAYLGSYSGANPQATYLGDPGTSGYYFGTDPLSFQILLQPGAELVLVLNETTANGGFNQPASILIQAFSDNEYTDLSPATVPSVPEPGTYALLACGIALLGAKRLVKGRAGASAAA